MRLIHRRSFQMLRRPPGCVPRRPSWQHWRTHRACYGSRPSPRRRPPWKPRAGRTCPGIVVATKDKRAVCDRVSRICIHAYVPRLIPRLFVTEVQAGLPAIADRGRVPSDSPGPLAPLLRLRTDGATKHEGRLGFPGRPSESVGTTLVIRLAEGLRVRQLDRRAIQETDEAFLCRRMRIG